MNNFKIELSGEDLNNINAIFDIALKHPQLGGVKINTPVTILQQKINDQLSRLNTIKDGKEKERN